MKKKVIGVLLAALMMTASLAACSGAQNTAEVTQTSVTTAIAQNQTATQSAQTATQAQSSSDFSGVVTTANVTSGGAINTSELFTERDLTQNADTSSATSYTLTDNNTITITEAGVYVLTGSASNATVIVDAPDDAKVQLVLNGVTVNNTSAPAIYVKSADKVFVTTAQGTENTLNVTGAFTADGETNTDAVIFSKDDLVLNGLGTLNITSSDNGISGKDDIKITGGTINITSTSDAIEANDSIAIADGTVNITSQKDGLHAENDEDNSTGYIYICGGTINIEASGDGVQGTTVVQIDGGTITVNGSEGIEATYVQINGGTITVNAYDDGINASAKSTAYTVTVEINGGDITINMAQGDTDGVDSNGNLYLNGGTISINAQSPFDYDGTAQHNGGTIIVNGTETNEITNQMMGGSMMGGGMGGPGGMGGGMMGGFR